ncbi:DUF4350 domain-containing protein [Microbacterium sp. P04]|uniref:DUF4350 domain-containing protein n=1 Tax=Microbacterium sp. P04 TaxID=3366947 RepID=UPI0037461630
MSAPTATRRRRRTLLGWLIVVAVLVAVALVGGLLAFGGWTQRDPLDPESAAPEGTRALARVLAEQGIDLQVVRGRDDALDALGAGEAGVTLMLPDAAYLSDDAIVELSDAATDVVLIEPRARTLRLLLPGSAPAGAAGTAEVAPECTVPAAQRAGGITAGSLATAGEEVTGCYPVDDGFALLTRTLDGRTVSALDARPVFANDALTDAGNAALALNLLGSQPRVVWYVPSLTDADVGEAAPTLGELTPDWVTPVMLLLLAAAGAAALWRGRRFGALVAEDLPVTVRASETTTGRARLYARSQDAGHAIDQLRLGTLERIGRMLGLPAAASPAAVADAVAQRSGSDRAEVHSILIDTTPRTDRQLVELAERLRSLETRVHDIAAPHTAPPERDTP